VEIQLLPGECKVLVGENGLGKTTLAARIAAMSTDAVMISQGPLEHFYDRKLSTFKNILRSVKNGSFDQSLFEENWKAFGLQAKEDRQLSQLSGGENQALKIAIGMASSQSLLILDEPSLNLDQERKNLLRDTIQKSLQQGKSILLIEHDLQWLSAGHNVHKLQIIDQVLRTESQWTT
jgi:ABC-type Mn2+/Zn2+ transport system ATPase subunit